MAANIGWDYQIPGVHMCDHSVMKATQDRDVARVKQIEAPSKSDDSPDDCWAGIVFPPCPPPSLLECVFPEVDPFPEPFVVFVAGLKVLPRHQAVSSDRRCSVIPDYRSMVIGKVNWWQSQRQLRWVARSSCAVFYHQLREKLRRITPGARAAA
jgi:hypothetical protein